MQYLFTLIVLVLASFYGYSQKLLTEFSPTINPLFLRVGAASFGDSLFVMEGEARNLKSGMWISANGTIRKVPFGNIFAKHLIGVQTDEDGLERYYFADPRKKGATITCFLVDGKTDSTYWQNEAFEVRGIFLGVFFQQGLNIISADPDAHILRITKLEQLEAGNETTFDVSSLFSEPINGQLACVSRDRPLTPNGALASVKVLLTDSLLTIARDDIYDPNNAAQAQLKTTVYELNLHTGNVTSRFYPLYFKAPFHSMIFDGQLYRIVDGQSPVLQVLDLRSGDVLLAQDLTPVINATGSFAYFVHDEKNIIRKEKVRRMGRLNYLMVDSVGSEVVVRIGRRFGVGHALVPSLTPFGMAMGIASLAANLVLLATPGTPSVDFYLYLKGRPETGFSFSSSSGVTSQNISNDELDVGTVLQRKLMHVPTAKCTYGLYLSPKPDKIQVKVFR